MKNERDKSILINYNCKTEKFTYPVTIHEYFGANFDERPLWQILSEDGLCSESVAGQFQIKLREMTASDVPQAYFTEYFVKSANQKERRYRIGFICPVPGELISITVTDVAEEEGIGSYGGSSAKLDDLTGLLNRNEFIRVVEAAMRTDHEGITKGNYALVYFDVIRFKAVNDMFGVTEGDRLLKYIADCIRKYTEAETAICRLDADKFVYFTHDGGSGLEQKLELLLEEISKYELPFKITCNVGIYITNEEQLTVNAMIDRAVLAQSLIKGSHTENCKYYTESLRKDMLTEQEISGMMTKALKEKEFVLYYQPQYNHSTGMLVGAEALVRWIQPDRGMISPGVFIPIFEKNGFITKLDLYVFERTCEFVRKCMDEGISIVPVSSNFSRYDIFQPNFVEKLEALRKKYNVPTKYLRIEITESVMAGGSLHANEIVKKLHECGYIVEMDDFGSGYSSLNVLKDIEVDIIKLDMMFLSEKSESKRGGTILSSMIRMARWLGMPVIAEGVETVEQADFLRSIGCDYIQGYLYSRPLPEEEYVKLLSGSAIGTKVPQLDLIETLNAYDFWNPKSQETLIFSNYVGGAAIFDYHNGEVEVLRVNQKYMQEMGMNLSERDLIDGDPMRFFDEENKKIYFGALERAIATGEEQECETWRDISSECCGSERFCIRSNVRMIGKSNASYLFYAMIRNVTAEKEDFKRFKMASEQVNIYYWEYNVSTKEMRPCFRCMRDLGLPALLRNYPESAIEMGVFPPEVADMYRDWHRQIEKGVKELEAVIPLTENRIPFRVRYTTEFDENENPVKAYGSAALVVE